MKRLLFLMGIVLLWPTYATQNATILTLQHAWQGAAASQLAQWIADYERENGGAVRITAQYRPFFELEILEATGWPDMIIGPSDWAGTLARNNRIAALDTKIAPGWREELAPVAWELAATGGRVVAVPIALEGTALFYNRALVSEVPQDWDTLLAEARRLSNDTTTGLVLNRQFFYSAGWFVGMGGTFNNFNIAADPAFAQYLEWQQTLWREAQSGAVALDEPGTRFRLGEVSFNIAGTWNREDYLIELGENLGVAALPAPWVSMVRAQQLYFNARTANLDAALDFARFVTSASAQQQNTLVPVAIGTQPTDPQMAVFADQLRSGVALPNYAEFGLLWRPIADAIEAVTQGGEAVAAVVERTSATLTAAQ